jgi:hypothetical protein
MHKLAGLFCVMLLLAGCGAPSATDAPVGMWKEIAPHNSFGFKATTYLDFRKDHGYTSEEDEIIDGHTVVVGASFDSWKMNGEILELQAAHGSGLQPGWTTKAFQWVDQNHMDFEGSHFERVDKIP